MATSENTVAPGISALASAEGYDKMLDSKKEKVSESKESSKVSEIKSNPLMSFKSGSSSGVGASASTDISGPSISKDRAKASSNSNQLGSILAGKTYNNSGRAPVWAAPAMANVSAFKESEEAKAARELEEKKRLEEIEAKKAEEEKARAAYTSIADSAKSHKSAFFKRAQTGRDSSWARHWKDRDLLSWILMLRLLLRHQPRWQDSRDLTERTLPRDSPTKINRISADSNQGDISYEESEKTSNLCCDSCRDRCVELGS